MTETWSVEEDTSLLLNDEQSLVSVVFCLRKQKQDVRAMILHVTSGREELDRTEVQLRPSHCRPGRTPDSNICQCTHRGYLQTPQYEQAILVRAKIEKVSFTRSEESRSAFITLNAIFLNCRNVVRVCIGWSCDYHICVLPDYSISGESSPDCVSVQIKRHVSRAPI